MRSSTIAAEFLSLGHSVHYVGEIEPINLILQRFQEIGISYPVSRPEEIEPCKETDILLIDSYTLKPSDSFITKNRWLVSCSISDNMTPNYDVDLTVRPSLTSHSNGDPKILTGPNHMLLRRSISKNKFNSTKANKPLKILIAGGGTDPSGFCNAVIETITSFSNDFVADVFSENVSVKSQGDPRIKVHPVSLLIDKYAKDCDLAFTLASTLSIELIAREIPIGIAPAFENQINGFQEMVSSGFAAPIGIRDEFGSWDIDKFNLQKLIDSDSFRGELKSRVRGLIDLGGAYRVASKILELSKNQESYSRD